MICKAGWVPKGLFVLFLILNTPGQAQWLPVNSASSYSIYDVCMVNDSLGYHCGVGDICKTLDGGNSWTSVPFTGMNANYLNGCSFRAMHFFSTNNGLAVGWSFFDDAEIIISTSDGGFSWSIIHLGPYGTALNDVFFVNSQKGYAVGENGRVLQTTNGGSVWTVSPLVITADLRDVEFYNSQHGVIVGDGIVASTNSGGMAWNIYQNSSFLLNAVTYKSTGNLIAVGDGNKVYSSINSGQSWTVETLGVGGDFSDVAYLNQDTGYILTESGIVLKTGDGGQYWETQSLATTSLYSIKIISHQKAFISGSQGQLYINGNFGGAYNPIIEFSIPSGPYCQDSVIQFTNHGSPFYDYQWLVDSQLVDTTYHLSYAFPQGGINVSVSLIGYNQCCSNSVVKPMAFEPSLNLSLQTSVADSILCSGQSTDIVVHNSDPDASYQLYSSVGPIGSAIWGNGANRLLNTGSVSADTDFYVVATKNNLCGNNTLADTHTVFISEPKTDLNMYTSSNLVCRGDSVDVFIDSTVQGSYYSIIFNGVPIASAQGNGGLQVFTIPSIQGMGLVSTTVTNQDGCSDYLDTLIFVDVTSVEASFDLPDFAYVGDTFSVTNNTASASYFWTFDSSCSTQNDTVFEPLVSYSTAGTKEIQLIVENAHSCQDTLRKEIEIFEFVPTLNSGTSCLLDTLSVDYQASGRLTAQHVDRKGNIYVAGYRKVGPYYYYHYRFFLHKYNRFGQLMWEESQVDSNLYDQDYGSSYILSITTDEDLNVYLGGSFSVKEFNIDTISVNYPWERQSAFIIKLDSLGVAKWLIHSKSYRFGSVNGISGLEYVDEDSSLYCAGNVNSDHYFSGYSNWQNDVQVWKLDKLGQLDTVFEIDVLGSPAGWCSVNPVWGVWGEAWQMLISPQIKLGKDGKLYFYTTSSYDCIAGNSNMSLVNGLPTDYVAVLDRTNGWERIAPLYGSVNLWDEYGGEINPSITPIYTVDSLGYIYVHEYCGQRFASVDSSVIVFSNHESAYINHPLAFVTAKFDPYGNMEWYTLSQGFEGTGIEVVDDQILLYGEVKDTMKFHTTDSNSYIEFGAGGRDIALISLDMDGKLNWVNKFRSKGLDKSYYMIKNYCDDVYLTGYFADSAFMHSDTFAYNGNGMFVQHFSLSDSCFHYCPPYIDTGGIIVNGSNYTLQEAAVLPNPFVDYVEVRGVEKIKRAELYSIEGRQVLVIDNPSGRHIDLKGTKPGIYILRVYTSDQNWLSFKIIKC